MIAVRCRYLSQVVMITLWNVWSSTTAGDNVSTLVELFLAGEPTYVFLMVAWCYSTFNCLYMANTLSLRFKRSGLMILDMWSTLDIFYILAQLTVNTLYWARDQVPPGNRRLLL